MRDQQTTDPLVVLAEREQYLQLQARNAVRGQLYRSDPLAEYDETSFTMKLMA